MTRRDELIGEAAKTVQGLFTKHGITDPNQAQRLIRERATAAELDSYYTAIGILDQNGGLG